MWSRLETIAVEDVGFGDLNVPVLIHALDQMRKNFPYNDGDQPMYFIHAIRVLCACTKDRSSDYLKNIIIKESAMGKVVEVPDIALDKHTKRGQEMGRGSKHFFEEATKVIPQLEIDNDYRERYGRFLKHMIQIMLLRMHSNIVQNNINGSECTRICHIICWLAQNKKWLSCR